MKNKVNFLFTFSLLLILSSFVFISCEWKNEEEDQITVIDCDTSQVTLSGDVQPILSSSCYRCHSTQNAPIAGAGIDLEEIFSSKSKCR